MRVAVSTPSRVHLSLVDMHGEFSGRVDGGVGMALREPRFEISVEDDHRRPEVTMGGGDQEDREEWRSEVLSLITTMREAFKLPPVAVSIASPLGSHAGLGSKTAILLSVCRAYLAFGDVQLSNLEYARTVRRGGTSSIGVHAFHMGGLIVDAGHSFERKQRSFRVSGFAREMPAGPLVGRYPVPDWPILLVTPNARKIHGKLEQTLFESICPIPLEDVRTVCHAILMMMIPAIIEDDVVTFGRALSLIQTCSWKRHQISSQSEVVRASMALLTELGLDGVGMSSWGSSIIGVGTVLEQPSRLASTIASVRELLDRYDGGSVTLTVADNTGSRLTSS